MKLKQVIELRNPLYAVWASEIDEGEYWFEKTYLLGLFDKYDDDAEDEQNDLLPIMLTNSKYFDTFSDITNDYNLISISFDNPDEEKTKDYLKKEATEFYKRKLEEKLKKDQAGRSKI